MTEWSNCESPLWIKNLNPASILKQWFSTEGSFSPREHLSLSRSRGHFWWSRQGRCYWHLVVEARNAAKHPTMHRIAAPIAQASCCWETLSERDSETSKMFCEWRDKCFESLSLRVNADSVGPRWHLSWIRRDSGQGQGWLVTPPWPMKLFIWTEIDNPFPSGTCDASCRELTDATNLALCGLLHTLTYHGSFHPHQNTLRS